MAKKKRILITGCLGHIGSYLIHDKSFLNRYDVVGMDNFATQRYCSLFDVPENFTFIQKPFQLIQHMNNFDVLIHLAAITDAAGSFEEKRREEIHQINEVDTFHFLLEKVPESIHVIFPSTTSVYGTNDEIVTEDSALNPQSPYAKSKRIVECGLRDFAKNFTILRFGTIVGVSKGMRFHTAANKFCLQSALGQPLTVWKQNYRQYRPYLSLQDACKAIKLTIEKLEGSNDTFNVLTRNCTTEEIVTYVKANSAMSPEINFVNTPLLNQFNYQVSQQKICKLGYIPSKSISTGIEETMRLLNRQFKGK